MNPFFGPLYKIKAYKGLVYYSEGMVPEGWHDTLVSEHPVCYHALNSSAEGVAESTRTPLRRLSRPDKNRTDLKGLEAYGSHNNV